LWLGLFSLNCGVSSQTLQEVQQLRVVGKVVVDRPTGILHNFNNLDAGQKFLSAAASQRPVNLLPNLE
jgi:hypothetical protein